MATATRTATSGGRPTGQQRSTPAPPKAASTSSAAVRAATLQGAPRVTLDAPAAAAPEPIGTKLAADEIDLSTGELAIPEPTAAGVKDGKDLDLKVRLPRLAEGTLRVRKRGTSFYTVGAGQAILLRHPALARFTASNPTVLVLTVKDNHVGGWVGLGTPGPAKGSQRSLIDAMAKVVDLMNWAGLSNLTFPAFQNKFEAGVIAVSAENFGFTVGGFLQGSGSVALDNTRISFDGSAKVTIPGGSDGELRIKQDPTGALTGSLNVLVQIGSVSGTVVATLSRGFVSVMGQVAYSGDRLSGKVTLVATDEPTARDITLAKPTAGGDVPIELPGPDKPAKPGKRAYCGWGQLTFRVTDWLAGAATVLVNSKGQATIVGEIAPPKEFILFEQKEWIKKIFKLEIKAGYGIPVVGQVGLFANIGLDAIAKVGPGKLYNLKMKGAYSTDSRVPKNLSIEGTLNISAFAGLRLRAEAGVFVTILGHDIKAGVGLNAIAGVRGYVEATPRIGMRELAPGGKRDYFIQGHLEIAAQPVLGFSGELFVAIETPWWSPLSDKRWTWPLLSIEYPLPGEFGIGADVDYVLGSKQWPKIEFGEVNFDGSKFLTDVMNDNTDSGSGGETKKPGDWQEGLGAKGKGGAKNKGGAGKKPGEPGFDSEPVGEPLTFSDGKESHRLWFVEGPGTAKLMVASEEATLDAKLGKMDGQVPQLLEGDRAGARMLIAKARALLPKIKDESTRVAIMKEAERKAEETYRKHGKDKGRKQGGKKSRKDENKKLKTDEGKLAAVLKNLLSLIRMEAWKPIEKPAKWSARLRGASVSGTAPVEISSTGKQPQLKIGGKIGTADINHVLGGPAGGALNPSGRDKIRSVRDKLEKDILALAKIPIAGAEVQVRAKKALEKIAEQAASAVGDLGKAFKVPSLAQAATRRNMTPPWPVVFNIQVTPNKGYQDNFKREIQTQLRDQQSQLNALSVDQWVARIDTYKSKYTRLFNSLDTNARKAVAAELRSKLDEAKAIAAKEAADIAKARAHLQKLVDDTGSKDVAVIAKARTELQELEDQAGIRESPAAAAARQRLEKYLASHTDISKLTKWQQRRLLKLAREARMVGRSGQEKNFQDLHAEGLAEVAVLKGTSGAWDGLKFWHAKVYALLHNPDQVAGGHGTIADLTPVKKPTPPTNPADVAEQVSFQADLKAWEDYKDKLSKFVGHSWINSIIGGSWGARMLAIKKELTSASNYTAETYGLWQMHMTLDYSPK